MRACFKPEYDDGQGGQRTANTDACRTLNAGEAEWIGDRVVGCRPSSFLADSERSDIGKRYVRGSRAGLRSRMLWKRERGECMRRRK